MDYEKLLSPYKSKACVISVDFRPDGSFGNVCVVAGNRAHCEDMEIMKRPFMPGSPYETCFPKSEDFEKQCFHCARLGKPSHAYINHYTVGVWMNLFLIPVESDRKDVGYCVLFYEMTPRMDSSAMTDIAADTAYDVLKACVKLRSANDTRQAFQEVAEDIREICDSEHACILLTDSETRTCTIFGDALKNGTSMLPMTYYIDGFYDITETWPGTMAGKSCIIVKDDADMRKLCARNPIWGSSLAGAGVKNIVLYPLRFGGKVYGYMWALNFNVGAMEKIRGTLELTTFFLASEVASYLLMKKMEIMGSIDSLTGIKNRNVMNTRVDRIIAQKEPVPEAVVFADLNCLKRMNDEKGHGAGDDMLRSAASILQGVFHDGEVYRAGGDEFLVLASGISEEELQKRIECVRDLSEKTSDVCFSIGVCYGEGDILRALHLADERMYADKNEFYEKHPEAICR